MFSRISRYRDLPDVVTVDEQGRAVKSKALRLLPAVGGTMLHTVAEGDRLDALAQDYFGQSRSWWHIADANPAFLSPLEMLGAGTRGAAAIPVEFAGATPPWAVLLDALRDVPGVEDAHAGTAEMPVEEMTLVVPGTPSFTLDPAHAPQLDRAVVTQAIPGALEAALTAKGVALSADLRVSKPDGATWIVDNRARLLVLAFRLLAGPALNAYHAEIRWRWMVSVRFNRAVVTAIELADAIETLAGMAFTAGVPAEETAAGRRIVIPPRPA